MKKLLALPARQVRRKTAFQRAARAGQSRSEVRPALIETTCAQWRAGCFNLVVGMGEASGRRGRWISVPNCLISQGSLEMEDGESLCQTVWYRRVRWKWKTVNLSVKLFDIAGFAGNGRRWISVSNCLISLGSLEMEDSESLCQTV